MLENDGYDKKNIRGINIISLLISFMLCSQVFALTPHLALEGLLAKEESEKMKVVMEIVEGGMQKQSGDLSVQDRFSLVLKDVDEKAQISYFAFSNGVYLEKTEVINKEIPVDEVHFPLSEKRAVRYACKSFSSGPLPVKVSALTEIVCGTVRRDIIMEKDSSYVSVLERAQRLRKVYKRANFYDDLFLRRDFFGKVHQIKYAPY